MLATNPFTPEQRQVDLYLQVQVQPGLHRQFQTKKSYRDPITKQTNKNRNCNLRNATGHLLRCQYAETHQQKSNEEVDDNFHLVIVPDCFPRLTYITFCGSFLPKTMPILPDLQTQKQNKRSRVWVPEFSFCGLELKSSSRTCPRSQELRTWLSCRSMFLLLFSLCILQ